MQFVDHVQITLESGAGGDGMVAWRREKFVAYGGPAGGDGGDGGSVYLEATDSLHTLLDFKYQSKFKAQDGERGRSKNQFGKHGEDLVIAVPCGTVVYDTQTGDAIADLIEPGMRVLVAAGGRGGRGNSRFTSSRRQAPQFAEPGEPGIERSLSLELKLMAEIGLVGMPNAGKSTLISVISSAKPKIADYPFTTLTPNLGVVRKPSGDGVVVADIPGLIEGASDGVGLGHAFLRHVERTRLLLHLVDLAPPDGADPTTAYHTINQELQKYSARLAQKPQMVVLSKQDLLLPDEAQAIQADWQQKLGQPVWLISAVTQHGVPELMQAVFSRIETLPVEEEIVPVVPDLNAFNNDDSAFEVHRSGKTIHVLGGKLDRLVRVTDLRNRAATYRLMNIFKAMGVYDALRKAQVKPGQTIVIGGCEFEYQPDED